MERTGPRNVDLIVRLLTLNETPLYELPSATVGGSLELATARTITGTGDFTCVDPGVDWLTTRVAPAFIINGTEYPAGIYLPVVPDGFYSPKGSRVTVQLMDKLTILDQDPVNGWVTYPAGTVGTDAVRDLIESTGESAGAITPSDTALRTDMTFDHGATKLQVINKILEAIGYFSLAVDWSGQYRAEPYVLPAQRPQAAVFDESRLSWRTSDFSREQDLFRVPNVFQAQSQSTGDEEALSAEVVNSDPNSPFSTVNRGRRIGTGQPPEVIEAATEEILYEHANRRLIELSSPTATLEITHAWLPLLLNDVVGFQSSLVNTSTRATVTNMRIPLDQKQLVTTRLREVITL